MGVAGLFFFMVGYARVRKDLVRPARSAPTATSGSDEGAEEAHRVAALCSAVWQNRKRTSLSDLVKAYLLAIGVVPGTQRPGRNKTALHCEERTVGMRF